MNRTGLRRLLPPEPATTGDGVQTALFAIAATRQIEAAALAKVPAGASTLMQRAGHAIARLVLARFPLARHIWVAAGPGNNGGDAIEAAAQLTGAGRTVHITWLGHPDRMSKDTARAIDAAHQAGLLPSSTPPDGPFDLIIDGLLGIGIRADRPAQGAVGELIDAINASDAPVLAVDTPSGLLPDTGAELAPCVTADATLTFLSAKPGFFTAHGRDRCGEVWLDLLEEPPRLTHRPQPLSSASAQQVSGGQPKATCPCATDTVESPAPDAWLHAAAFRAAPRLQESNKGTYGDVAVIGGAPGMAGAPLLASRAAMAAGSGRVYVGLLDPGAAHVDVLHPELMFREPATLRLEHMTVACGCGGGAAVEQILPDVLSRSARLVLDADGLNAVARSAALRQQLVDRAVMGQPTVITPHPLEAARLLGIQVKEVQNDRFAAARTLANELQCVVVLKGSGTLVAVAGCPPFINASGNPALATAGTGDVLAGWLAGYWSAHAAMPLQRCIANGVWWHGHAADRWRDAGHAGAISASMLVQWLTT